ncbi:MAG: trypsin-like peptidase domain-containing protein [Rikenellaceae bacterium]
MKRVLFSVVALAVAATLGVVVTLTLQQSSDSPSKEETKNIIAEVFPPATGSRFTANKPVYSGTEYPDLTYAAENAVRAVVGIEVTQQIELSQRSRSSYDPFRDFFGFPQQQNGGGSTPRYREQKGGGSGVIISEDGYIVTNNHVVGEASKIKVKTYDGDTYDAEIVGTDPTTDIALIKINAKDLPTLTMGSSRDLRLGEWVLAIGSPFDLQSTITAGIVSAKARQLDVIPSDFRIESFIQTDAAINPGNSGGALVNSRGELVGINTLIKTETGSYVGYSFAVPESIVRKVVVDLREFKVVQRAMLGVSFAPITADFIEQRGEELGIKEIGGVYVASVQEEGAASEAGIRKGDIIISVDGTKITSKENLPEMIAMHRPGDKVKIVVKRGSSMKHFDVTLRNKSGKAELVTTPELDVVELLGGRLVDVSQKLIKELDIEGGVEVSSVEDGGMLSRARVRKGFIITHINDRRVLSVSDIKRMGDEIVSIDGIYPDGRSASYMFVR